jgi:hypothetical protein
MSTTTPEMNLVLPDVSLTLGPEWASELNTALEVVSAHTHTPGDGNLVPTAGLGINGDLTFNSYAAITLERVGLDDQLAALTDVRSIYSVGGDLYYTNTAGDQVQITNGNSIAGTPGAITGLGDGGSSGVYYDATNILAFYLDGASQAKFDISTIQLHAYDASGAAPYTEYIALTVPTTTVTYSLTLPAAVPTQTGVLGMDTTGAITQGVGNGTVGAPSMYFAGDKDTGLYLSSANTISASAAGSRVAYIASVGLGTIAGTAADPSLAFIGDTDTGLYAPAANTVGVSTSGTLRLSVNTAAVTSTLPYLAPPGALSTPSYTFAGDLNTGIYSPGADTLTLVTGGTAIAALGTAFRVLSGSASIPGLGFITDTNTGLYNSGADELSLVTGGSVRSLVTSSGLTSGSTSTADAVKWKVFTGTLTAGDTITLSNPGTALLGLFGVTTLNGGANYNRTIVGSVGASTSGQISAAGGSNPDIILNNEDNNSSNSYRVVMMYQ